MADRLSYLRALAINTLITDAVSVFLENEEAILKGEFEVSLLDRSRYKAQIEDIIQLSVNKIYCSPGVIEKEIAGYKIISDILEVYTGALVRQKEEKPTNYDKLLLETLPHAYRNTEGSIYSVLLNCCCFVASLSDSAAVHIHNKISGKQL
jgi:dGTPase